MLDSKMMNTRTCACDARRANWGCQPKANYVLLLHVLNVRFLECRFRRKSETRTSAPRTLALASRKPTRPHNLIPVEGKRPLGHRGFPYQRGYCKVGEWACGAVSSQGRDAEQFGYPSFSIRVRLQSFFFLKIEPASASGIKRANPTCSAAVTKSPGRFKPRHSLALRFSSCAYLTFDESK
jgi:hypothetical protein